ncbi:lysozyme inhibitor LprI family protein [Burkholderia sp. AU31624]|uniref:lysozyme inhibitor LprI family protein n=1 Tax=Burkholderia sp. AU31624 TaxID=2879629 RepID=UPI001CF3E2F6|nr:lysozyme inhibitor LprI family protein [Burkholderia sp. AU31624]MCA8256330.1 lysozyme inhibitor LprI family protein [Burkholderia sp. AU31624]
MTAKNLKRGLTQASNNRIGTETSMKPTLQHAACVALLFTAASAHAIDCQKAGNRVEHTICADEKLKAADAEMGKAYTAVMQQAGNDSELRAMLVRSQKRWLAARDKRFADPVDFPGAPNAKALRASLLQAIRQRTETLSERGKAAPRLLETALAQRTFLTQFTGGPFAGFETRCDFLPHDGQLSYGCFSERRYQNQDRICTLQDDWASGGYYETRLVGNVVQGRLETVAACGDGSEGGSPCPDADETRKAAAGWNLHPGRPALTPTALPKLDAEAELGTEDTGWLRACLTDSRYPRAAR